MIDRSYKWVACGVAHIEGHDFCLIPDEHILMIYVPADAVPFQFNNQKIFISSWGPVRLTNGLLCLTRG